MLKKRIIPCLLLKGGRCVKSVNFKNHRDVGHPITNAKIYEAQGADELILLDIEASQKRSRGLLLEIVRQTADECFMPFCAGGGIKSLNDINNLLRAGVDKVAVNTMAVKKPDFIRAAARKFGRQCVVMAIDYKVMKNRPEVFINNGQEPTGLDVVDWAKKAVELGAGEILLTNINKEGKRNGYDLTMIKKVTAAVDVPVIAAGGCGSLEDLKKAIASGAAAVSLASILHFTDQNVIKARNYLITSGIDVRINI